MNLSYISLQTVILYLSVWLVSIIFSFVADLFKNVGIVEQNMAGIAAGLAMTGYNLYFYSIGNFPTLRCREQIRNDIAYHHANVKVIAEDGGHAYGDLGATHHATEALGMMRTIPNIVVCSPSDPIEARALTTLSSTYDGPMYIQLGKAGEKIIRTNLNDLAIGDILPFRVSGNKEAVLVTGSIASVIVNDERYKDKDIYTAPFVKPLKSEFVQQIGGRYSKIIVIEEHQISGGLGSAIIEVINDLFYKGVIERYSKIQRIAINDYFQDVSGSQMYLRKIAGFL